MASEEERSTAMATEEEGKQDMSLTAYLINVLNASHRIPCRGKDGYSRKGEQEMSVAADLIDFLNAFSTTYHAMRRSKKLLKSSGYEQVSERGDWKLQAGNKYFFTRNHSTIVAFAIGRKYVAGNGFHIVGAHTDSPCLELKPVSKLVFIHMEHTWFDRDLSIAGRMIIREGKGDSVYYTHRLVRLKDPIIRIPTLAIHLDRYSFGS
ncbi:hypothetical protein OROMI_028736 [Orobanche minor]